MANTKSMTYIKKQYAIIILLLFMSSVSFAQTFGIKAGMTLSTIMAKNDSITFSDNYKMLKGFHAGITTEIQVGDYVSIETGVMFSTKGYQLRNNGLGQDTSAQKVQPSLQLLYFDIPIVAKSWFGSDSKKTFGILGTYLGMGINGKSIVKQTVNGKIKTIKKDIEWGRNRKSDLKRLDYGLIIGIGIELNTIQISAAYHHGLANIMNEDKNNLKNKNRLVQISVAYNFKNR